MCVYVPTNLGTQLYSMCSYAEKQVRDELLPRRQRDGTTGLDGQEDTEDQVLGE